MHRMWSRAGWTVALTAGVAASGAWAQSKPTQPTRRAEITVRPLEARPLRAIPHGLPGGPGGGPMDDCVRNATYTDVDFNNLPGQSLIAEAGMANGEMAAATYVLTANDFPLVVRLAEMVFAGQTNVPTETHWSVLVWAGTPDQGQPGYTFSSDGEILQHLELPPGAVAGDIQFSIDPSDPEQIIIQDNPTHSFTVAFRIDALNQPSPSPCTQGAPTCCNVFPTVDNSGLSNSANNWLYAINCPLGCPAGWRRFNSLGLCRPSGDWVLRAQWESINCTPSTGACCFSNGTCQVLTNANCLSQNGVYRGDNVTCAQANCAQPPGACCFSNGNCLNLTDANCTTAGGTWQGANTQCAGSSCPIGACCLPSGACLSSVTQQQCTSQSGVFRGTGSNCSTPCPQPTGACCLSNGGCLVLTQSECALIPGTWAGAGTQCGTGACQTCYANCDGSTTQPVLNVNDFVCFQGRFAAADPWADCDHSSALNVNDFVCFQQQFAAGCP